ncbi:hypothetical protein [Catellatospora sp. NPDC049609]|uniref:hypothetical protein n=1 Tax=Catellatospora sp. NPDC049609 TaxID=3155505 RepID=UPI003422735A
MAADPRLAGLVVLALLTGCGAGGPAAAPSASPATPQVTRTTEEGRPRVLTEADDGAVVPLSVGQTATLRLTGPEGGPEPAVTGDAVLLIRIANVTGSGAREWEIRAVRPGDGTVTVPRDGGRPAVITLRVT